METLAYVVTSGWASGISVYTTVLVTGLAGRYGGFDSVPDVLEQPGVLLLAGALAVVEFVADKIPYVDSAWDVVHTVIRTGFGAVIGALIAGQAGDLNEAVAAALGGTSAMASHAAKASLRLAANASPEPFSNIALSLSEDTAVVGVLLLAIHHPWAAFVIALALLLAGTALALFVLSRIRTGLRRLRGRVARATN